MKKHALLIAVCIIAINAQSQRCKEIKLLLRLVQGQGDNIVQEPQWEQMT